MKQKLLTFLICLLVTGVVTAQVTAGQVDDFEDGTTQSWFEGGASPNPPVNISTDGPAGAGDNYLQADSDNSGGNNDPGSRMVIRNIDNWTGDFTAEGIVEVRFDARVFTNDLDLRIAMSGPGGRIATINAVTVTAGSGWTSVSIPIQASDLVAVQGSPSPADILEECFEMRILSSPTPAYQGEAILSRLEVDNITASTTLSTSEVQSNEVFKIFPNPGKNVMNIALNGTNTDSQVEVFDILGKRIYSNTLSQLNNQINIASWNSGVYLVKITSDNASQTKRFVKH
ncbi:MAG: T9SS type A sorting domain-containing protein [bacterium]